MTGRTLSHFEVLEKLGEGGMGVVYKARDTQLNRFVALKLLLPGKVADPERRRRFVQEARAASSLSHPNIVTIHEISQADGADFIAMEFVAGRTLDRLIPRGGMRLTEALRIAVQVADGLARAHAAGIVHRDLKPSNIIVAESGGHPVVKILDFGLAKLTETAPQGPDDATLTEARLAEAVRTDDGVVVGTVAYMSPEQAEGKPVNASTDIFAFGALLYEMLSGRRAFAGDSKHATLAAVLRDEPAPLTQIPHELEKLIARCLRKEPARRAQHMSDLKLALEELKEESESGSLPAAAPAAAPRSMRAYVIVALAAVAVVLAGIWVFNSARREAAPPVYRLRQMTRDEGISTEPALSPDGRLLAYSSDRGGGNNMDIWVQQVAGGDAIRLTRHPAADISPRFSPDGSQIVFYRDGDGIYLIPSLGGTERLLVKGGNSPAWSPDGKFIAYTTGVSSITEGDGPFVVPATAGAPRKVETGVGALCCPVWSPDGRHLLIKGNITGNRLDPMDWFIVPSEGGAAVKISVQTSLRRAGLSDFLPPVAWLRNRDLIIFSATQSLDGDRAGLPRLATTAIGGVYNIWQLSIEPATGAFRASPQRLTAGSGEFAGPASLDGRIPFSTVSGGMTIYALPLDDRQGKVTGELVRIGRGGVSERHPTLTSDGKKMVFVSNRAGSNDVWMKELATGEEAILIGTPENEGRGVISPDGSQVVFWRIENGRPVYYLWPLPAGPERKLCDGCRSLLNWTSDAKSVIVSEGKPERLVALNVADAHRMLVASHPKYDIHDGCLSRDMRWITFKLIKSLTAQPVYIAPVRNGAVVPEKDWIRITGDHYTYKPFWSQDGKLVYFYSLEDHFPCLYARRLDAATKQPQGEAFAVRHFHGDQRPADGTAVGYGQATDRLYLPIVNRRGNVWLAEPEKSQ
jgi:eukaryotic-like serine/threonine-protein kinase